ncbi:hypothetical protein L1887_29341 [Cichorium endivia]|nr:hypothetical protein L1887_29341 [Cichorium endivia]
MWACGCKDKICTAAAFLKVKKATSVWTKETFEFLKATSVLIETVESLRVFSSTSIAVIICGGGLGSVCYLSAGCHYGIHRKHRISYI